MQPRLMRVFVSMLVLGAFSRMPEAGASEPPPFTFPNDTEYEESTWLHSGLGYINQVVHPDIIYFPGGWGNVDGKAYKYWMGITPYAGEQLEQPCVLVTDDVSNDSWLEPAGNYYDTNPIVPYGGQGHYSDVDIVYNDDTDEIYCYYRNVRCFGERIELYKSPDGVNWRLVSYDLGLRAPPGAFLLSPAVIKEGSDWWMWFVDASHFRPNHILLYHSDDGKQFTFSFDCGFEFRADTMKEPWHINVIRYNNEYWGLLTECPLDLSGEASNLYLIRSTDRVNWVGYDSPILSRSLDGWDEYNVYRATCIVQDGFMDLIYTGAGSNGWHAGYTQNASVGGIGLSSNIIPERLITDKPPVADFIWISQNTTAMFDASSSFDPDGSIVAYEWDFGDNSEVLLSEEETIDNTYALDGPYAVTLIVTDNMGKKDSCMRNIYIGDEGILGDVNSDGNVNPIDVVYLVNYVYIGLEISGFHVEAADINSDGAVNPVDVVFIVFCVYR